MRVLIADKFENSGIEKLKSLGCEVLYQAGTKDQALVDAIKTQAPDVLVVRSTKVNAAMLDASKSLKLVVRAGAGYNTIDVPVASQLGIYVSNCPGKNSVAVAELAFGLILSLDRRIADNVISLRKYEWKKDEYSKAKGLFGRTLGLIGVGQIGQEMIPRALAFGMQVIAWSRSLTPARAAELGVTYASSPLEVAKLADVVSVHLAMSAQTKNLIGAEFFGAMKSGAFFINTSRGEVVDQLQLLKAMREKKIRAGLDVFANEPTASNGEFKDEILNEAGLYGTHHIGASTEQAQEAIAAETARIIQAFKETGKVPNVVNLAERTPATHMLVARHRDRPGVLAHILGALRAAEINVQEMENTIFSGAEAAVARINLDKVPSPEVLERIAKEDANIIQVSLVKLS